MLRVQNHNKLTILLIYLILALATFIAYQQVGHGDFVWDDFLYITNNPNVKCGITRESVVWAFSSTYASNWHPVTWLSHMLDCELFGLNPLYHHLVNLLFHVVNTLLLFWVLKRMTGAIWRSAFVAAVFALHPLHVESVAWVAERKDLLCGFFWMLTIAAYIRYAQRPSIGRYLLVMLVFGLGLMAKPMMVTLPFVLLLLDYWPLGRFQWSWHGTNAVSPPPDSMNICYQRQTPWRLICEKIPLFILMVASAIVTFIAQQKSGAMELSHLSVGVRIANAIVSYVGYMSKMAYPCRLAVLYPHSYDSLLTWQPIVSAIVLTLLTVSIIYLARQQRHYLVVGWLWYLGTLVPVIGLIQIGVQSMADRYTYLPSIGIFIIVAWGVGEILAKRWYLRTGLAMSAGIVVVALLICTRVQVRHWRDSLTLFGRAFEVTKSNPMMLDNLGSAFVTLGKIDEAVICYTEALRLEPDSPSAHQNLGTALTVQGKIDEAIGHYRQALQFKADFAEARNNLAFLLGLQGNFNEAVRQYREVLKVKPDYLQALSGISWILATHPDPNHRDPNQAIELAEHAAELTSYKNATVLDVLAAAYASAGRFPKAVETAQKALDLAQSRQKKRLTEKIQNHLSLYKASKPYIEPLPKVVPE